LKKTNLRVGLQFCSSRSAGQLAAAKAGRGQGLFY